MALALSAAGWSATVTVVLTGCIHLFVNTNSRICCNMIDMQVYNSILYKSKGIQLTFIGLYRSGSLYLRYICPEKTQVKTIENPKPINSMR